MKLATEDGSELMGNCTAPGKGGYSGVTAWVYADPRECPARALSRGKGLPHLTPEKLHELFSAPQVLDVRGLAKQGPRKMFEMTKQKKFKNRVRARMERDGLNYTQARQAELGESIIDQLVEARGRGSVSDVVARIREHVLREPDYRNLSWTLLGSHMLETLWPFDIPWGPDATKEEIQRVRKENAARTWDIWERNQFVRAGTSEFNRRIKETAQEYFKSDPGAWFWETVELADGPLLREDEAWYEDDEEALSYNFFKDEWLTGPLTEAQATQEAEGLAALWEHAPDVTRQFGIGGGKRRVPEPSFADQVRQVVAEELRSVLGEKKVVVNEPQISGVEDQEKTAQTVEKALGKPEVVSEVGEAYDTLHELHGATVAREYALSEIQRLRSKLAAAGIDPNSI